MSEQRRGICPGLTAPIATGDGLLARLATTAPIDIAAFIELCKASRAYGNGIVEVTQRGSVQVRGLRPATVGKFVAKLTSLGLGSDQKPPILASPLSGLANDAVYETIGLVSDLRDALGREPFVDSLSPKVSVLIDGAGALHLDDIVADVRVVARHDGWLHVAVAGDATTATTLGWTTPQNAVVTVCRLLREIAANGPMARAAVIIGTAGLAGFGGTVANGIVDEPPPAPRGSPRRLGVHPLKNGSVALGVALAFGHADAEVLERLAEAAAAAGATSLCPTAGRVLLLVGVPRRAAARMLEIAEDHGCVVRANDPRRHVVACAGAPACASGTLGTRDLAPIVAAVATPLLDGSVTIHLSGCAKRCAHHGLAHLTVTGPGRLSIEVGQSDTAAAPVAPAVTASAFCRLASECCRIRRPGEDSADALARLGAARIASVMRGDQGTDV